MLLYSRYESIPKHTTIYCPHCKNRIAKTNSSISLEEVFDPIMFDFYGEDYEEEDEPECQKCGTPWLSEDIGIFTNLGWYPQRH
jgi:hypothetical protein